MYLHDKDLNLWEYILIVDILTSSFLNIKYPLRRF